MGRTFNLGSMVLFVRLLTVGVVTLASLAACSERRGGSGHLEAGSSSSQVAAAQTPPVGSPPPSPGNVGRPPTPEGVVPRCGPIDALLSGHGNPKPLPRRVCSTPASLGRAVPSECPANASVVFVFDDDANRPGERVWHPLKSEPWGVSARCQNGMGPLETQIPKWCSRIQDLGADRQEGERQGRRSAFFECGKYAKVARGPDRRRTRTRQGRPGARYDITPASYALSAICDRIAAGGADPAIKLAFFAFDGVTDGAPESSTPADEFAKSVLECTRLGLHSLVVADPERYRYVYALSKAEHAAYAHAAAQALAKKMGGLVLSITPWALAQPGTRRDVSGTVLERVALDGPQTVRDNALAEHPDGVGEQRIGTRLAAGPWLSRAARNQARWELRWNHAPHQWQGIASQGTRLAVPMVHINRPLKTWSPKSSGPSVPPKPRAAPPMATDGSVQVVTWGRDSGCVGILTPRVDPNTSTFRLFDALMLGTTGVGQNKRGTARLDLWKGPGNLANWGVAKKPSDTPNTDLAAVEMRGERSPVALALVSPGLEIDPCVDHLRTIFTNVHLWKRTPTATAIGKERVDQLQAACRAEPLSLLVDRFLATKPSKFPSGTDRMGSTRDKRTGIEAVARSLSLVGSALAKGEVMAETAGSCVLATLRVTD